MEKINDFIARVSLTWATIGGIIAFTSITNFVGVDLIELFSDNFIDETKKVIGAVFAYIGYLKSKVYVGTPDNVLQSKTINKSSFAFNPFKNSL